MLWILAVSGCAYVWRVDELPPADAPGPDSAIDAPMCTPSPVFSNPLTDTSPCSSWGTSFVPPQGALAEGSGSLTVTMTSGPAFTGCNTGSRVLLDDRGFFVEIDDYLKQSGAYTRLALMFNGGGGPDMSGPRYTFGPSNGFLQLNINGVLAMSTQYIAAKMKFVRLRADAVPATMVIAEYSADAASWIELIRDGSVPVPSTGVWLELLAGENGSGSFTDTAVFSHFNVCP